MNDYTLYGTNLMPLLAQLFAASLGMIALMVICYGIAKLWLHYFINK